MLLDYCKDDAVKMTLNIEGIGKVTGEFMDCRINPETLPEGTTWYQVRLHDHYNKLAALKRGLVVVNFYGTFICKPIEGLAEDEEIAIKSYRYIYER